MSERILLYVLHDISNFTGLTNINFQKNDDDIELLLPG
jgi:hypothetical protein